MKALLRHATQFLLLAVAAFAVDIKVGTLNCYLLFDPAIDHPGKVDDGAKMTPEQYRSFHSSRK